MVTSKPVDRATNPGRPTVEDMGVNHRRLHVAMTQKLLYRSNIVTAFQKVSCKRKSECMACSSFGQASSSDGIFHGFLKKLFIHMMASLISGLSVLPPAPLGKDPLPSPVGGRVGILAV